MTNTNFDPNGLAGRSNFKGLHPFAIWYDSSQAPQIAVRLNTGNGRYITLGHFDDDNPAHSFALDESLLAAVTTARNTALHFDGDTRQLSLTDSEGQRLTTTLAPQSAQQSFERVAQNINSWDASVTRDAQGAVAQIHYSEGTNTIIKTFRRASDGQLEQIELSGELPHGIKLTKTLVRDGDGMLAGATYS